MSSFNIKRRNLVDVNQAGISTANGEPLTSFSELSVSELSPAGQGDFIYNINTSIFKTLTYSSGTVTQASGVASVNSGVNVTGSADLALRRNLKYRPGLGSLARLTCMFDTAISGNVQLAGIGNPESGYYFAYYGTSFGIIHNEVSQREIRKLTVTTGAGTGNTIVTLNGVAVAVPMTGGANTVQTAHLLSQYNYSGVGTGWSADAISSSVYFISSRAASLGGAYSVANNSIVGSFSSILTGAVGTQTFIPQSSWNIDRCDGTGPSSFVINPQKGNVYQIGFQYLGFGNAFFAIENPETGRMIPVHMIKNTNARTTPVLKNPQATTRVVSANIGATTSVSPKTLSMAAFTEGMVKKLDPRFAYSTSYSNVNSATYLALFTIKANTVYANQTNYGEFDILRIAASNESTAKTLTVALFRNAPLGTAAVNYQYINEPYSICSVADFSASPLSFSTTGITPQLVFSVGANSAQTIDLVPEELVNNSGETITVAIKTSGQVSGEIGINWFEQQ
jgi:hypothetical protein